MSSPFSLFRKHQKMLMVVLIGLSMLSFVIFGTVSEVSDFGSMPASLKILAIGAIVASIAWVSGIPSHKSSEYGTIGLIAGVVVGAVLVFRGGPPDAVTGRDFSLSQQDLQSLIRTRSLANHFVAEAVLKTHDEDQFGLRNMRIQANQFGFDPTGQQLERDVVLGQLLTREARDVGIAVPDEAVFDFINELTNKKLTAEQFKEIRRDLGASERELVDALRHELTAKQAAYLLYRTFEFPPEAMWEFSKRLQVRQTLSIGAIPVEPFIDETEQPPEAELEELFNAYRELFPGTSMDGKLVEGQPGFRQPPRVRLAYVQPDTLSFEAEAEQSITDEMIQTRYEERYRDLPAIRPGHDSLPGMDSLLPPGLDLPPELQFPLQGGAPSTTPAGPQLPGTPSSENPASEDESQSTPDAPTGETDTSDPAPEPEPQPQTDAPESGANENSEDDGSSCGDDESSCDDEPAAEESDAPAETSEPSESPAAETPEQPATTETPAAGTDSQEPETSASETENETPAQAEAAPASQPADEGSPSAEPSEPAVESVPDIMPLDDELKQRIREELIREKTEQLIQQAMESVRSELTDLGRRVSTREEIEDKLTVYQAMEEARKIVDGKPMSIVETDLMTFRELIESEDHPVAQATRRGSEVTVARELITSPEHQLFAVRSIQLADPTQEIEETYLYWKTAHVPGYIPSDLSDERVREQVVRTWRELRARERAEERAREMAELVRDSDRPLPELLAEKSVTGEEGGIKIEVTETGQFSWMRQTLVPSQNPFQRFDFRPEQTSISGLEPVGPDFMRIVFDELEVGEVGVAPSQERTEYYVVKVESRIPANEEQWEIARNNFLSGQYDRPQDMIAAQELNQNLPDWSTSLLDKYEVAFYEGPIEN